MSVMRLKIRKWFLVVFWIGLVGFFSTANPLSDDGGPLPWYTPFVPMVIFVIGAAGALVASWPDL